MNSKMGYYITCLLSGAIELGTIFVGIKYGFPLTGILGLALAYQSGNVFRFFVNKKISKYQTIFVLVTLILGFVLLLNKTNPSISWFILCVYYLLYSTFLQNIRSVVQGDIPRWKKRSCRVIGFMLSFTFYLFPNALLIITSALLLYFSIKEEKFHYEGWIKSWINGEYRHRICWTMVTHQAHYFVYNYVLLYLIFEHFLNPIVAAGCFVANWIPYTITEPMVKKMKWNCWYKIAVLAHLFNSAVLLGMYVFYDVNIYISVLLWVLTGFGGGNVFCVKKALSEKTVYEKTVWNFSEQIGHILGVSVAIVLCMSGIKYSLTMIASMFFAVITIPILAKEYGKQ